MGVWSPLLFTVLVEGSSIGKAISLGIYVSARQHNPDPLVILSRGYPRILQSSLDGQLQATGCVCVSPEAIITIGVI